MHLLRLPLGRKAPTPDTELLLSVSAPRDNSQNAVLSDVATSENEAVSQRNIPLFLSRLTAILPSSWRGNIVLSIVLGIATLILNLGVTIWALTSTKSPRNTDVVTVYQHSCPNIQTTSRWIHLAINILSTGLLAASNMCMQILCAPTREEVDAAHARHKWLGIGISSLKNLLHVDPKRSAIWFLLGLSSVPLHLLWNSAFVNTLVSNNYVFSAVTEGFLLGDPYNNTRQTLLGYPDVAGSMLGHSRNHTLNSLNVTECIKAYGNRFVSNYGNLLLVYDMDYQYNSLLLQGQNGGTGKQDPGYLISSDLNFGNWMCRGDGDQCDFNDLIRNNVTYWNPWADYDFGMGMQTNRTEYVLDGTIKYCLVEEVDRSCRLSVSLTIMKTILICNVIKIICFVITLLVGGSMYPLITNGDAVQSFLLRPDTNLQGPCLVSKSEFVSSQVWSNQPSPSKWHRERKAWLKGATNGFWFATFIPYAAIIV